MANLTFTQVEDYTRAYANELDSAKITQAEILIWSTLAQRKVQLAIESIGLKTFKKTVVLDGAISTLPADLRDHMDSIRSVMVGIGNYGDRARKNSSFSTSNAEIYVESLEPGSPGNGGIFYIKDASDPGAPPHGTIRYEGVSPWDFDIWVDAGTTASELIELAEAYPTFNEFARIGLQSGNNGTGVITTDTVLTTEGATATTGWVPAKEITDEEYDRFTQTTNVFKNPTATEPAYCIKGDPNGVKSIYFVPNAPPATAVWTSKITYEYLVSDVTVGGSLSIPKEYEEMVLIEILVKMFDKLDNKEKRDEWRVKFDTKVKELGDMYQNKLGARVQEKSRIQATDPMN